MTMYSPPELPAPDCSLAAFIECGAKECRPRWPAYIAAASCREKTAAAGERPPHKETQAYGCCVSTLTRLARPPSQRPLTGSRGGNFPPDDCTYRCTRWRRPRPECGERPGLGVRSMLQ